MTEPTSAYDRIGKEIESLMIDIKRILPPTRESSLVLTKLEEAIHWLGSAAVRSEAQPHRKGTP